MKKFLFISVVLLAVLLVQSQAFAYLFNVPSVEVKAQFFHLGPTSYFKTVLSEVPVGYDVYNGDWVGWCCDESNTINPGAGWLYKVKLYDVDALTTAASSLPSYMRDADWDNLEYLLNNKVGTDRTKIQQAIWNFVDGGGYSDSGGPVDQMTNDATANGDGFDPQWGQKGAVFVEVTAYSTNGGATWTSVTPDSKQGTFIEADPVPEPGTLLLLGSGLVGMAGYGKLRLSRKKKKTTA